MDITIEQTHERAPVTIMKLTGKLDASCYEDVIAKAKELYQTGTRNLLLDLSDLSFMSSAGIIALHRIALLMRGEQIPETQEGWAAFHDVSHYVESGQGFEKHFKLLNPNPRVGHTLETAGFKNTFEIYTDSKAAIASFE